MPVEYLKETASQTAGPYLHIGMYPAAAGIESRWEKTPNILVGETTEGQRIRIEGTIIDGNGQHVRDAAIEIWQANAAGRYNHPEDTQDKPLDPAFTGFGRAITDARTGLYWFETVKPGPVVGPDGREMAPHINVAIFGRGINIHLVTRLYFEDEGPANEADHVLRLVDPARRGTLIARREEQEGRPVYRFDIVLQGENETVFFDV